jgi:uncharacterized membrane protein
VSSDERRLAALLALLGGGGVLHFVIPGQYEKIVPPGLGDTRRWVLASGLAELVCAALLATPRTRRAGGYASAGLFLAVFPANLYSVAAVGPSRWKQAVALARLPLQVPMVTAALTVAADS